MHVNTFRCVLIFLRALIAMYIPLHVLIRTRTCAYTWTKMDKYIDQPNFVPFIVETGGRVGVAGRWFLDTLIGRLASDGACAGRRRWTG